MTIWHGTQEEALALQLILKNNCDCIYDQETGSRVTTCAGHLMLAEDQHAIDHLLFVRRALADRMLVEEFT